MVVAEQMSGNTCPVFKNVQFFKMFGFASTVQVGSIGIMC